MSGRSSRALGRNEGGPNLVLLTGTCTFKEESVAAESTHPQNATSEPSLTPLLLALFVPLLLALALDLPGSLSSRADQLDGSLK